MNWLYLAAATIDANSIGVPKIGADNAFDDILNIVYFVAGIVAVISIIIAAFYYVISAGRADKIKQAKNGIISGVVGLVVVMIAFAITQFVIGRVG